uniref:Uncharacterized protein n=1 Tax=Theropithecus gelada TaxID=9565 RepID=A0A8D2GGJ1_THEGE
MPLQPACAPKLQPPSVCRRQPPGNPRHLSPHSQHLRTGARCPSCCGQARRSALGRLHGGGNPPSAPFPATAEGAWLVVPSSGRGGAGRGQAWQALRPGALGIQRPSEPCSAARALKLRAPSACSQQPGHSQARWRSRPPRTRAGCRRGCGQARRSARRRLHRGGNWPSAPSPVAAEGPASGGRAGWAPASPGRPGRPWRTRKPPAPRSQAEPQLLSIAGDSPPGALDGEFE